jgi:RNA polymerase sigma factor (sigma-70 family)
MDGQDVSGLDWLASRFESHRAHLRAVAYRMLGSNGEAEDAVQEAWLRLARSDTSDVENLGAWLTTVVARVSLDMLRSRRSRPEEPLGPETSGPAVAGFIGPAGREDPESEAVLADSVGLALLVVLDTLTPAERLAFVLHDLFGVPFDEIGPIVERSPVAAKKLASRARHRVRGTTPVPAADRARQRRVVDAFLAATRGGDIEGLLAVLDPDVVRRADDRVTRLRGGASVLRGARAVAEETAGNSRPARFARPALVDGRAGVVVAPRGRLLLAIALTIEGERITEIDMTAEPERLRQLELAVLDD